MALRLTLKPQERVIIGGAVIKNGDSRTEFFVMNEVPVLREPDILSPGSVQTPCERIYLAIQLMYVDPTNLGIHQRTYWTLVGELVSAAPSLLGRIDRLSREILAGNYYRALRLAQKLIAHETEMLHHVRPNQSL